MSYPRFDEVWNDLSDTMEKQAVVYTLSDNKPNRVVSIGDAGLEVITERSFPESRPVPKSMFKKAWNYLIHHGQPSQTTLLKYLKVMRSAFVIAALSRLQYVHYDTDPVVIHLGAFDEKKYQPKPSGQETKKAKQTSAPQKAIMVATSCGKGKRDGIWPACQLYKSPRIKALCNRITDYPFYILSSEYGLVRRDKRIETYDRVMDQERADYLAPQVGSVIKNYDFVVYFKGGARQTYVQCMKLASDKYKVPIAFVGHRNMGDINEIHNVVDALLERNVARLNIGSLKLHNFAEDQEDALHDPPSEKRLEREDFAGVVDALTKLGQRITTDYRNGKITLFADSPEADRYLFGHPLAYLIGVISDYGVRAEKAWSLPYRLSKRLGHLDIYSIATMKTGELSKIMKGEPSLHRFPTEVARYIILASQKVVEEFHGKPENIWWPKKTSEGIYKTLIKFAGIGQKKASMAVNLLVNFLDLEVDDLEKIDVSNDVHVRRLFQKLGISKSRKEKDILQGARRLCPSYPGILDLPAWYVGKYYCRPSNPACNSCPLNAVCPN
ncbi:MAG: hypothetical protein HWN68_06240 [Desulfobacterales bacterium]|nr:hypothetical protein [Desulfobacterales bacterium]